MHTTLGGKPKSEARPKFPVESLRTQFPALKHAAPFIFFDNAAGAQIPQIVFDAINRHLLECNVQRGGRYPQSIEVDATIDRGRRSVADLLGARDPSEVAFGMNATSFIRLVSLAIGQSLGARNEIIVSEMDHEANIATWMALESFGAKFHLWKMRDDGNLHSEDLWPLLSAKTRLVACTVTSNALGSIVDVPAVAKFAHDAGAELFLDCVHYGPHGLIDVQAWGCDYLACSGYKIFAPHMGFMWGKRALLEKLPTFREDFIPNEPPGKIEAGTFVYENVAGMTAAIEYLELVGKQLSSNGGSSSRRANLITAMAAIRGYEEELSIEVLEALEKSGATIYGIRPKERVGERVPTFCFNLPRVSPQVVTEEMARAGIGIRDGHMYAPRLMKRLSLSMDSGAVRASLVHYNTSEEIQRFSDVLQKLSKNG
jgi:cysteine desulfurase family protein (TIGR01976 family)